MIDASSKLGVHSLLQGSISDLGGFDQCLDVRADLRLGNRSEPFAGQYCMVKTAPPLPPQPEQLRIRTQLFNFTGTSLDDTVRSAS